MLESLTIDISIEKFYEEDTRAPNSSSGRRKWNKVRDNRIAYVKQWRAAHECIQKDAITRCTSTL